MNHKQCVILVGGLGTRLGGLTENCPKPLLDVAGKPFLYYLIWNARRFGFDDFVLLAGYKNELVLQFADGIARTLSCQVRAVVEESPQGTGGALLQAEHLLDDYFLLMNGDSFFDFNLLDLNLELADSSFLGCIALRQVEDAVRFGVVQLVDGCVKGFSEKPKQSGPELVNGGVYLLSRRILEHISKEPCSLERDVFPSLAEKKFLAGKVYEGFFLDIGIPEDFELAQQAIPAAVRHPAVLIDCGAILSQSSSFTHLIEGFQWAEGGREAIRWLNDKAFFVFVLTSPVDVAQESYFQADVLKVHRWMTKDLASIGGHIDGFCYRLNLVNNISCSNSSIEFDCLKSASYGIIELFENWPIQAENSFLLGKKQSDLDLANRAGVRGILYSGGDVYSVVTDTVLMTTNFSNFEQDGLVPY